MCKMPDFEGRETSRLAVVLYIGVECWVLACARPHFAVGNDLSINVGNNLEEEDEKLL